MTRYTSGSDDRLISGGHKGQFAWNGSTDRLALRMYTQPLASGRCADSWFDWATRDGHYDARLVRNCAGSTGRTAEGYDGFTEGPLTRSLLGIQKAASCLYSSGSLSSCSQVPENSAGCSITNDSVNEDIPNGATEVWIRYANGTADHIFAGRPDEP